MYHLVPHLVPAMCLSLAAASIKALGGSPYALFIIRHDSTPEPWQGYTQIDP